MSSGNTQSFLLQGSGSPELHAIGSKPCQARECVIADAICNAELILRRIDERLAGKPRLTAFCGKCSAVRERAKVAPIEKWCAGALQIERRNLNQRY